MQLYESFKPYLLSFIPLFIAIGALDFVPFVNALTEGVGEKKRKRVILESCGAAALILLSFLLLGKAVFLFLGVSVADFMVAGGLLLLVLSIKALAVDSEDLPLKKNRNVSIVPLATPLIAGPAAMATTLILLDSYGAFVTLVSIVLNCVAAWLILDHANLVRKILGDRGSRALSKVSYILLASIAVMMIRRGFTAGSG